MNCDWRLGKLYSVRGDLLKCCPATSFHHSADFLLDLLEQPIDTFVNSSGLLFKLSNGLWRAST